MEGGGAHAQLVLAGLCSRFPRCGAAALHLWHSANLRIELPQASEIEKMKDRVTAVAVFLM